MEYRKQVKWSIILASLTIGLAGCEGPGPEYQTPMAAYPETPDNSLPVKTIIPPKMAYEEIYREKKPQDLRTVFLFDSSKKPKITPAQKKILKQQAHYLKENPRAMMRVEGYIDSKGNASLNKKVASLRANEIAKFLSREGISAERLEIVSLADKKSQVKNRRVELIVLPEGKVQKS